MEYLYNADDNYLVPVKTNQDKECFTNLQISNNLELKGYLDFKLDLIFPVLEWFGIKPTASLSIGASMSRSLSTNGKNITNNLTINSQRLTKEPNNWHAYRPELCTIFMEHKIKINKIKKCYGKQISNSKFIIHNNIIFYWPIKVTIDNDWFPICILYQPNATKRISIEFPAKLNDFEINLLFSHIIENIYI